MMDWNGPKDEIEIIVHRGQRMKSRLLTLIEWEAASFRILDHTVATLRLDLDEDDVQKKRDTDALRGGKEG